MPWRMITFLIILTVVVFFAGFNISNASDVSFGFYTISGVPIFISLFIAYLAGTLTMVPFLVGKRRRGKGEGKKPKAAMDLENMPELPDIDDVPSDQ